MLCAGCKFRVGIHAVVCQNCGLEIDRNAVNLDKTPDGTLNNAGTPAPVIPPHQPPHQPGYGPVSLFPRIFALVATSAAIALIFTNWIVFPLFSEVLGFLEGFLGPLNIPESYSLLTIFLFNLDLLAYIDDIALRFGSEAMWVLLTVSIALIVAAISFILAIGRFIFQIFQSEYAKKLLRAYRELTLFMVLACAVIFIMYLILNRVILNMFAEGLNYVALTPMFYVTAAASLVLWIGGGMALKVFLGGGFTRGWS
jgi:hypothetical protein